MAQHADHIAIMNARRGLIGKILSGEKNIESRWYRSRVAPWGRIHAGDTVYFKESGKMVTARAEVALVQQFDHPSDTEVGDLIDRYAGNPGICAMMSPHELRQWATDRPYIILVFLRDPRPVIPFSVSKEGFGSACAWMCLADKVK